MEIQKDILTLSYNLALYECLQNESLGKDELKERLKKKINSSASVSRYLKKAFEATDPFLKIENETVSLNQLNMKLVLEFLSDLFGIEKTLGNCIQEKSQTTISANIGKIEMKKNPVIEKLKKENEELKKRLREREEFAKNLQEQMDKVLCQGILADMDKTIRIESIRSVPKEVFKTDIFLINPGTQIENLGSLSRQGGVRKSFYTMDLKKENEMTRENWICKIGGVLCKSSIFSKRMQDEESVVSRGTKSKKLQRQIHENRIQSLNLLLRDTNLTNQAKLALYAGWHEYHGSEMEELLNFAGDHAIDANAVIYLLERPMDFNNYENVRGFLRQACKSSEARIRREAAKELISGEWYVLAEYKGKETPFVMVPFDELERFRKMLCRVDIQGALGKR